jgi:hypothetical protein
MASRKGLRRAQRRGVLNGKLVITGIGRQVRWRSSERTRQRSWKRTLLAGSAWSLSLSKQVEADGGWQEVARYVHLNPVRVVGLELHKAARAASRAGLACGPAPELLAKRLRILREYRWSSYPGYAGYPFPA